jgi:hypothetical protein
MRGKLLKPGLLGRSGEWRKRLGLLGLAGIMWVDARASLLEERGESGGPVTISGCFGITATRGADSEKNLITLCAACHRRPVPNGD